MLGCTLGHRVGLLCDQTMLFQAQRGPVYVHANIVPMQWLQALYHACMLQLQVPELTAVTFS